MDAEKFGAFVQQQRKALGMNQAQLAEKLHVTAKAVSRWERGVGFPSIELLQPLADALEITIAELMQSQLMEKDLPKEEAAELVAQTMDTIRQQEALTWKRKLVLFFGNTVLVFIYLFLQQLGLRYNFEPRWIGLVLGLIGIWVYWFGIRALRALITGEPFFLPQPKRKWQYHAAGILAVTGIVILLVARVRIDTKPLREFLSVFGVMMAFICGCYMTIFNEDLSQ